MKSIGIDIGTTTISFAVTDNDTLAVIQKYTIASAGFIHTENPWERIQDTDVILSRIRPVLNDILDTYSDISAIGITSQMHGIVYTDRSGRAVSPLYTWQDGRGSLPEFGGRSICRILSDDTGIKTASGYGLVTHLFNVRKGLVLQMHRLSARSEIIWAWYSQAESRPSSISVRLPVWDCLILKNFNSCMKKYQIPEQTRCFSRK